MLVNEMDKVSPCDKSMNSTMVFEYGEHSFLRNYLEDPVFEEEERLPLFLRKVRKLNSSYPNFGLASLNPAIEKEKVREIAAILHTSLSFCHSLAKRVEEKNKTQLVFLATKPELFTVKYFLHSKWQHSKDIPELQEIKPKANFERRAIDLPKIYSSLTNYESIAEHYAHSVKLELPADKDRYFEIRKKLWSIEKNLRYISEDIYAYALNLEFPLHYYEYLSMLKAPAPRQRGEAAARHHRSILNKVLRLQASKEPLSCSEVGRAVREKVERELKLLL